MILGTKARPQRFSHLPRPRKAVAPKHAETAPDRGRQSVGVMPSVTGQQSGDTYRLELAAVLHTERLGCQREVEKIKGPTLSSKPSTMGGAWHPRETFSSLLVIHWVNSLAWNSLWVHPIQLGPEHLAKQTKGQTFQRASLGLCHDLKMFKKC